MTKTVIDVGKLVDEQPFGAFHWKLLIVSFLVMTIDGYDLGAAAFSGPMLLKEFGVSRAALGALLSAGLFGGLFGAPLFGVLADRFGRKPIAVFGAVFFGVLTLATIFASSFQEIIVLRFFAGLGTAGVMPVIVSLNSEYAPRRFRATMVVAIFCGVTLGNGLPGLVAAHGMGDTGWRLLFWIGGLVPIALGLLMAVMLPESVRYLALQPDRRVAVARIVRQLAPQVPVGPETEFTLAREQRSKVVTADLLRGHLAKLTPLLWITNLVSLLTFNSVNSWLPTLLEGNGFTMAHAAIATTLFQFGGTFGSICIMRPLDRFGFLPVPILFAASIPILMSVGTPGLGVLAVMALVFCAGFCLLGLQVGIIASEAPAFPTGVRARGVGSCFAAGRIGSSIGPILVGALLGAQVSLQMLFVFAAAPLLVGLLSSSLITPLYRRHVRGVGAPAAFAEAVPAK